MARVFVTENGIELEAKSEAHAAAFEAEGLKEINEEEPKKRK
ncbi:hypothetical protein [Metabacillus kandeliae]|nr:hypothetical protein [Metabacillus kandeliae]